MSGSHDADLIFFIAAGFISPTHRTAGHPALAGRVSRLASRTSRRAGRAGLARHLKPTGGVAHASCRPGFFGAYPPRSGVTASKSPGRRGAGDSAFPICDSSAPEGGRGWQEGHLKPDPPSATSRPSARCAVQTGPALKDGMVLSGCKHTGSEGTRAYWVWYPHI